MVYWLKVMVKQECIPVGCVPSATVAVGWEMPGPKGVPGPGGGAGPGGLVSQHALNQTPL